MNLFSLDTLSLDDIIDIISLAKEFKEGKEVDYLGKKSVAFLFYENSTRTHYSFEKAALNLGCKTQNLEVATSSVQKGESLYDTCKFFESIGTDVLVIRHLENKYYDSLQNIRIPILSGGDGTGNHPSQSLLDLMTIHEHFGYFTGLKIAIIGDIKHSRVAHTNYQVMKRLGMEVCVSGPSIFQEESYDYIPFEEAYKEMDVVMLLRVQEERHKEQIGIPQHVYLKQYGLTMDRVHAMKENAIIMHPGPFNRNVEIEDAVVECSKSKIFEQMRNGVFIRMALIHRTLENE